MRIRVKTILTFAVVIGLIGCSNKSDPETYKIGALLPLTGNVSFLGEYIKSGIDLAVDEINRGGGIRGKKLEVLYEDTKNDPKEGVSIITRLVSTQDIPVFVTAMTGVTNAVIPVADAHKRVVMATTASASGIPDKSPYAFRLFITADLDAVTMARYAATKLGLKKIAIVHVNDEFGKSFADKFTETFTAEDRRIILREAYEKDARDFRGLLLKIKEATPDGIYLLGYNNNLGVLPLQIREAGIDATLLSIGTLGQPNVMKQAGKSMDGAYFTTTQFAADHPATGEARRFVEAFQKKYGKAPNYFSAFSYDSIGLLAQAIEKGGYSPDGIREALVATKGFKGAMGNINIMPNGDAEFRMVVKQIRKSVAIDAP